MYLNVVVNFDDQMTDADSVAMALNIMLENALSTPAVLEYEDTPDGDPRTQPAQRVSVPEPQFGDFELGSEGAGEINLHLEANYYKIGSNSLDSLIGALNTLMDTALSTPGVLDELGTIEVSGFAPVN